MESEIFCADAKRFVGLGAKLSRALLRSQILYIVHRMAIHEICFDDVKGLVPRRDPNSHKYDFGRLQIFAGSRKYPGAAILCARAAYSAGCGYVHCQSTAQVEILKAIPELLLGIDSKADAFIIGPGLDLDEGQEWMEFVDSETKRIIDASALSVINVDSLSSLKNCVFTPHSGEAAKMFGVDAGEIEKDREAFALKIQSKLHASSCFLLKGARSLAITSEKIYRLTEGNVSQANAGQGDALSGVIGALLAQGFGPEDATLLGASSLARCAERLSVGQYLAGNLASDLIQELKKIWAPDTTP